MARHKLIQSYMLSLKVKSENPIEEPTIYGIVDADDNDPIQVWINTSKVDNFMQIMPKSWNRMIQTDKNSSGQYSFLESMDPVNRITENTSILFLCLNILHRKKFLI